ncbi:MAG TPA: hypothetical protein VMZ50_11030, partial [Phycisphaerae bacterium]|nr:hypothetical protein [Phycisphaerae bacterium]
MRFSKDVPQTAGEYWCIVCSEPEVGLLEWTERVELWGTTTREWCVWILGCDQPFYADDDVRFG